MPRESTIQVYRSSVTDIATGLTFGELAYTDVNGRLFVGRTGGSALWIGAGITTGTIATNSTVLVPTQSAVKTYVDGVVGGGSVVNSVNGSAGVITVTGDGGSLLATVSGTTTTFSNRLASTTLTGVASFNSTRFTVSAAGAVDLASAFQVTGDTVVAGNAITATRSGNSVTIDNNGVRSFNGSTGAVNFAVPVASFTVTGAASFNRNDFTVGSTGHVGLTGTIARTNINNQFTTDQTVSGNIIATQLQAGNDLPSGIVVVRNTDILYNTDIFGNSQRLVFSPGGNSAITLPSGVSGTVALVGTTVATVNGATGPITITGAGGAVLFTQSGRTGAFDVRLASSSVTGVASFGNEFIVSAAGAVGLTSNYVRTFNGLTGTVSFAVPVASASTTGVASFGNQFVVSAAGAVSLTSNYVISVNGSTGAVTGIATTSTNTFTGLQTMNAGLTTNHLYVTNGATFASRIQGVGATFTGTVEIDTGLMLPNGQTITSAVSTFNGASGAVSFAVPVASASVTGVASFNATRFTVSAGGAVDLASAFQVTGDTVVAGNAITATRSGNSVTIDNNGVRTFNGATGAITLTGAGGAILFTQSGAANTVNARTASTSLTGVASFNSASFDVSAGGDVTIKTAGVSNTQLANSSVTVAAGGNSTLSLGNTLTFTGGATPNIVFSNTANTVTATLANDIVIPGNLTVNGTVVTANVNSFIVEDPLFMLGTGNAADSVDLGFYAQYTSGGRRFAGFFRDASDGGKFKIFANLTGGAEPTTTVNDAASGYGIATIVANIDGGTF